MLLGVCSSNKGKSCVLCLIRSLCSALSRFCPSCSGAGTPAASGSSAREGARLLFSNLLFSIWSVWDWETRCSLVYLTCCKAWIHTGQSVWCCKRRWKCWGVQGGYFWISDGVSMAADASQRTALRYQQTLVGVFQFTFTCLVIVSPFSFSHPFFCYSRSFEPSFAIY